jgi:hypothetical protein
MPPDPDTDTATEAYDPLTLPEYDVEQYVVPVLNGLPDRSANLHGTAFFINGSGTFLTAGHVLAAARTDADKTGGRICLAIRNPGTTSGVVSNILATDLAPAPFDIAVGTTNVVSKSFVRLASATAGAALRNVMTFGYPESAQAKVPSGGIVLGHRAHKGYIVHRLISGQLLRHSHPPAFELSFPIPSALSGAPLVLERPATALEHALVAAPGLVPMIGPLLVDPRSISRHALHLIGVCVGTTEAETVAFAYIEVVDGMTKFSEKTSKIELYGLAHDLLPLADWKPPCLHGTTLAAAISPT